MRPTGRGVGVAAASIVAGFCSWLLGVTELAVLAVGGMALFVAAAVVVLASGTGPDLRRRVHPARVHAGDRCEIHLVAENRSRRRSGVVEVIDRVDDHGVAQLVFAPIPARKRQTAAYAVQTTVRGVHRVGPLRTVNSDPFGLFRRARVDDRVTGLVVLPRFWRLQGLPEAPGDEPERGPRSVTAKSTVDEEFSALRDWTPGDDVRRIHWRSTARRGTPVVRQFDVPWQRRTTVVLDMTADATDQQAFERAVSAAASIVGLAARRDEQVRLICTDGSDTGFLAAAEHLDDLMDLLAMVGAVDRDRDSGTDRLRRVLSETRSPTATRTVTCSALAPAALAAAVADPPGPGNGDPTLIQRGGLLAAGVDVLVATGSGTDEGSGPGPEPGSGQATSAGNGPVLIALGPGVAFDQEWSSALAARLTRTAELRA